MELANATPSLTGQDLFNNLSNAFERTAQAAPPLPPLGTIALNRLAFGPRPGVFDYATFAARPGATDDAKLASFVDW